MRFVDNVTSANVRMLLQLRSFRAKHCWRFKWCDANFGFYFIVFSCLAPLSSSSMRIVLFSFRTIRDADTGLISYISMVCAMIKVNK